MTTTLAASMPAVTLPQETAVRFVVGLPGLDEFTRYSLISLDDGPVYWLQCTDEPAVGLPLVDAFTVDPTYAFDLPAADVYALGLNAPDEVMVLFVLTVPRGGGAVTANMLAPVVINRTSWTAKQVILEGAHYSIQAPVQGWE